ncbi:homoserine O-acetyltransferase/O-succinyltransferase family protein [Lacticaseibacillus manihotivorans]|uniref:Homoserine O-succinyltransferase n=2 Tax=Lacticaseibacillus manihotivorans TaxID=88233 RepID=A0A0R1RFI0_9LACO|nr:homoserine O-succinyltransferase [Lacticaseibacillus manihotivorans]KRL53010.1 homoserine O-succinyltransferase [Lacticaseibacillus manihotivorans DSM 13343 = JCM 12514]QFQ90182.1 homoserine O-succinyltransferase [Lacticaseibacillus manihotivorans]
MLVGLLVLMHDKVGAINDWQNALGPQVQVHAFYPKSHVPQNPGVMQPLDLNLATQMDAFIVTGAPVDRLAFEDVWYYREVTQLIDALQAAAVPQLYLCWGAMAALHHEFGLEKQHLPQKLFGVYPQHQLASSPLLDGLPKHFLAPHARFTDITIEAMRSKVDLIAATTNGHSFLATAGRQTFLFAHLEYQRFGLWQEAQRANSGLAFNDDPLHHWGWENTRNLFFANWKQSVKQQLKLAQ